MLARAARCAAGVAARALASAAPRAAAAPWAAPAAGRAAAAATTFTPLPFSFRAMTTKSFKQPHAAGGKMKSVSSWKRRFRVAARSGGKALLRMKAGFRHKRATKSPAQRRRLRAATGVPDAVAAKMVVRGFDRAGF